MHKSWSILLSAAILMGSMPLHIQAVHTAEIEDTGENKYKSIQLSPAVYAAAQSDLSDLRIYDSAGDQVPYFIRSASQQSQTLTHETFLSQTDEFEKDAFFYFDFAAEQTDPLTDLLATAISFRTQSGPFAKEVVLYGSYDGIQWQTVCDGTLYRVDKQEQLEISFPAPQKFTHYRIAIPNNLERISFDGAMLKQSVQGAALSSLQEQLSPTFTLSQEGNQTKVELSGLRHLKLTGLSLEAEGMFRRSVSALGTEKTLYQLAFSQVSYADTTLPLNGYPLSDDTLVITIENADDKPLSIQEVTAFYAADELVFAGTQGPYRLTFGESLEAPRYDIEGYRGQVLDQPIDPLQIASIELAAPAPAPKAVDWQLIFNGVVVAIALMLGVIILLRIQKTEKK